MCHPGELFPKQVMPSVRTGDAAEISSPVRGGRSGRIGGIAGWMIVRNIINRLLGEGRDKMTIMIPVFLHRSRLDEN